MRVINQASWGRREHFQKFRAFDHPHFSICANVEAANYYKVIKQNGLSMTLSISYLLARAANSIPEFRYRIHDEEVVEYEVVHPSITILSDEDVFSFCTITYDEDFEIFSAKGAEQLAFVRENPTLDDDFRHDNYLFMTSIPWVSFTSFSHPMNLSPADSVPRFAWGKLFQEGEIIRMPLNVQVHHALMDGLHVGRYYARVQELLSNPGFVSGVC